MKDIISQLKNILNSFEEIALNKDLIFEEISNLPADEILTIKVLDKLTNKEYELSIEYKGDLYDLIEINDNTKNDYTNLTKKELLDILDYIKDDSYELISLSQIVSNVDIIGLNNQLSQYLEDDEIEYKPEYTIKSKNGKYNVFDLDDNPILNQDVSLSSLIGEV